MTEILLGCILSMEERKFPEIEKRGKMREKNLSLIQNETNNLKNLGLFAVVCLLQFLMDSTKLPLNNTIIEEIPGGYNL